MPWSRMHKGKERSCQERRTWSKIQSIFSRPYQYPPCSIWTIIVHIFLKQTFIHSFSVVFILHRIAGNLEPIPGTRGTRQETPWIMCQFIRGYIPLHSHIYYIQHRDPNLPTNTCPWTGEENLSEYLESTLPEVQGEHTHSANTGQRPEIFKHGVLVP